MLGFPTERHSNLFEYIAMKHYLRPYRITTLLRNNKKPLNYILLAYS